MAKPNTVDILSFQGYHIPILLYKEMRSSIRVSITKKGCVVRCPFSINGNKQISKAKEWIKQLAIDKPSALGKFRYKDYSSINELILMGIPYSFSIEHIKGRNEIQWADRKIQLLIDSDATKHEENTIAKELLSKFVAKSFKDKINLRAHQLNKNHYGFTFNQVRLKNNQSNWGSCSSKKNINIATRLLLAPLPVIDYVLIHELAHLKEMNHSSRFWNLVKVACPEHKKHEQWLRDNSHHCQF